MQIDYFTIFAQIINFLVGVIGLPDVRSEELILFPGNKLGIAFNLDAQEVAAVLLDHTDDIKSWAGGTPHWQGEWMCLWGNPYWGG